MMVRSVRPEMAQPSNTATTTDSDGLAIIAGREGKSSRSWHATRRAVLPAGIGAPQKAPLRMD